MEIAGVDGWLLNPVTKSQSEIASGVDVALHGRIRIQGDRAAPDDGVIPVIRWHGNDLGRELAGVHPRGKTQESEPDGSTKRNTTN